MPNSLKMLNMRQVRHPFRLTLMRMCVRTYARIRAFMRKGCLTCLTCLTTSGLCGRLMGPSGRAVRLRGALTSDVFAFQSFSNWGVPL